MSEGEKPKLEPGETALSFAKRVLEHTQGTGDSNSEPISVKAHTPDGGDIAMHPNSPEVDAVEKLLDREFQDRDEK